jgi:hypothetical protein
MKIYEIFGLGVGIELVYWDEDEEFLCVGSFDI